ncbi:hypothetical protein [Allosphingosinicella deserti]|uniref:Uncharacterized protein n=1 Tax=Allosphingosinicella deserti TaxID=2116704 RepID=A0A2P7QK96_9SPHN|nr:hypothetical protein [Sphingomonas deserti]PSJ38389.1 hypothetical protein C7I55_18255 [Sphingomonas deserti]
MRTAGWPGRQILAAFLIACLLGMPASAQEPAPADCAAVAAERDTLRIEHDSVKQDIADIATGRYGKRKKKRVSGGQVASRTAGTAASLLLPFPFGLAVGAAGAAATGKKKGKAPAEPEPDVDAMIARQQALETRLAELAALDCP